MMRKGPTFVLLRLVVAAALVAGVAVTSTDGSAGAATMGAVYVESNTVPNYVQVFNRDTDGALTTAGTYLTGGDGRLVNPPFDFPILDSQGSVAISPSLHMLFVVNAGSNTVSSFEINQNNTLALADQESSQGSGPISLTVKNSYLYVLNETSGTIAGFTVSGTGQMTPLVVQPLAAPALPATIGFDTLGRTLVVTERGNDTIETFPVASDGVAGAATTHPSTGPDPYGLAFTLTDNLLVANSPTPPAIGSISSYAVPPLSTDVTPLDFQSTHQGATCWMALTPSQQFAYATNPISGTITGVRVDANGDLKMLNRTGVTARVAGAPLDEAVSPDGQFLYVLNAANLGFSSSGVDTFRVNPNGSLQLVGSTPGVLPGGASGLAVR
jgi:6-phosphogluconolactonase (cycloisomerase 2 family)